MTATLTGGEVEITAPEVDEAYVDEIEAEREVTYNVQIPRDPITVRVTRFSE